MQYLLSGEQMQAADIYTQEVIGVPSIVLMERAALAVADRIMASVKTPENGRPMRVAAVAGKGNNGADALAVGRILMERGASVTYYVMDDAPAPGTNLAIQERIIRSYGGELRRLDDAPVNNQTQSGAVDTRGRYASLDTDADALQEVTLLTFPHTEEHKDTRHALTALRSDYADVYVDGLFGIGLTREITGRYREVIDAINAAAQEHHASVFAVDIPSGVHAGDGSICGIAVQAAETVTFGFYKRGQFLYPGSNYCGHLTLADIGIPSCSHKGAAWFTYTQESADDLLPERARDGNKGTFGKALIVAGSYAMAGAATMAASAAGRMGCGMVRVYTRAENRVIVQDTVPEALLSLWSPENPDHATRQLITDMEWADTVAIGPGLGKKTCEALLVQTVLEHAGEHVHHVILDADAIRLIAENDLYAFLAQAGSSADVILTPHLAECATLLKTSVKDLGVDRERRIKQFAETYHVTLLCKDARSMIASAGDDRIYLNTSGNDGLATAGSGDVLTGILTACTAQGLSGLDAAAAASWLHGRLAEMAEGETGRRGLVAPDLYRRLSGAAAVVWSSDFHDE